VVKSLADLIKSAYQNLKPVKIGSNSKQIDGLNHNRRGEPFIDNYLTVTRIDYINGKTMTVMVNRTGHTTIMETGGKEYGLDEEKIYILLGQVFPVQTSIGAFRLGDLLIVGAPGELIAELGLNIKTNLKTRSVKYPVI